MHIKRKRCVAVLFDLDQSARGSISLFQQHELTTVLELGEVRVNR